MEGFLLAGPKPVLILCITNKTAGFLEGAEKSVIHCSVLSGPCSQLKVALGATAKPQDREAA